MTAVKGGWVREEEREVGIGEKERKKRNVKVITLVGCQEPL